MTDAQMATLRTELTTDPLTRGYAGMSHAQASASLNTVNRPRNRATLSSAEIYEAIDGAEFASKTGAQQVLVRDILGLGDEVRIGPGTKARGVLVTVFGAGSATGTALLAAAAESVSRARELGLPPVKPGHVQMARS